MKLVRPRVLVIENVHGIAWKFTGTRGLPKGPRAVADDDPRLSFADVIREELFEIGYDTYPELLKASQYGVPQLRPRFFIVGVLRTRASTNLRPFDLKNQIRTRYLKSLGLRDGREVTVAQAISDLRVERNGVRDSTERRGFKEVVYRRPSTDYQRQMHGQLGELAPNSMRLARHRPDIVSRFREIIRTCRHGRSLNEKERAKFGLRKQSIVVLHPNEPAHTLTTLPDDFLHYSEPRILTVREYARLQSFPDWFEFLGKYTTGGDRRTKECPRYTQVGNAVPPRVARFIGILIHEYLKHSELDRAA